MATANHCSSSSDSDADYDDQFRLERFYDIIIDRQFWYEQNYAEIKAISLMRHYLIHQIYFSPALLNQLDLIDASDLSSSRYRVVELQKLVTLFVFLVETNFGKRTDLLEGLPPINSIPPMSIRPRMRLPLNFHKNPKNPINKTI